MPSSTQEFMRLVRTLLDAAEVRSPTKRNSVLMRFFHVGRGDAIFPGDKGEFTTSIGNVTYPFRQNYDSGGLQGSKLNWGLFGRSWDYLNLEDQTATYTALEAAYATYTAMAVDPIA